MGDVVILDCETSLDIPVERILEAASDLETVVVVGLDSEGRLHFGFSSADSREVLSLLEMGKATLMDAMMRIE